MEYYTFKFPHILLKEYDPANNEFKVSPINYVRDLLNFIIPAYLHPIKVLPKYCWIIKELKNIFPMVYEDHDFATPILLEEKQVIFKFDKHFKETNQYSLYSKGDSMPYKTAVAKKKIILKKSYYKDYVGHTYPAENYFIFRYIRDVDVKLKLVELVDNDGLVFTLPSYFLKKIDYENT